MSVDFELNAMPRDKLGKGASRRLRREGRVPAIIYGGRQEPEILSLEQRELLKQLENQAVYSHILTIRVEARVERAILKALQRHPFKPAILHVDLLRITADEEIRVHVPLHFINEETSLGVKQQGGLVGHLIMDVEVSCLPQDLPEFIEVDLANLSLGESIHLSELKLPGGVEIPQLSQGPEYDVAVVNIHARRGEEDEEEEAEGGEEAGGAV